jgi:dTDP-4-amino-4,6-dideoxy-D-glucose ammonia-lyase
VKGPDVQAAAEFVLDRGFLTPGAGRRAAPRRVAVVGAGRWAKVICGALAEFAPPLTKVVVVAERNFEATERWFADRSKTAGGPDLQFVVTRSLRDVVDDDEIEAAFVTKMATEHFLATRQLLAAGKHVLVEKPFVLSVAEAEELIALARTGRRTLAVGYEFMFARALHHFRDVMGVQCRDVSDVRFTWDDQQGVEKWGVRKQPDLSANVITDLYPHILSQLLLLFGPREVALKRLQSRDGCSDAHLDLMYGDIRVEARLDKDAGRPRREIQVTSSSGSRLTLDYTKEPGALDLDGQPLPPDSLGGAFPPSLSSEIAYFLAQTTRSNVSIPNAAEATVEVVDATERANAHLTGRQVEELRAWLWKDLPGTVPESVQRIIRHQMLNGLLQHGVIDNPKDNEALNLWASRIFRIVHRFSREPWTEQSRILEEERLDRGQLARANAAMRDSDFIQRLIVREGTARQYWSTILPLVETGSVNAVLRNDYQFPLRLGIYAAVSCMFSCTFCGRMENPSARYSGADVPPGNDLFDQVFAAMPRGVSTLSLGGGLEPLTNVGLDDVVRSAKRHGHKVPLVTNGYMLTPVYVKRHPGLWDVDVLRISLYGVDEESYDAVTKKRGAFALVKQNVIAFLRERQRRGGGPRVGFNFIVLVNTTEHVLKVLDLIEDINAAVDGQGIDFLTLREDFSAREGDGLSDEERGNLVAVFQEFTRRCRRECPQLGVDFGYALYPLSQGIVWTGLPMVDYRGMLPKAYPQVSVAIDLLGDVYLYRDAAFPDRPGANRYCIGRLSKSRSLETLVREFLERGQAIDARPNDPWLMDAFDHVVTRLIWQAQADERAGIPFQLGPVRRRAGSPEPNGGKPAVVNYWQGLFGA